LDDKTAAGNFRYSLREGQGQLLLDQQGTDLYEAKAVVLGYPKLPEAMGYGLICHGWRE
jgi:hypothetical protein